MKTAAKRVPRAKQWLATAIPALLSLIGTPMVLAISLSVVTPTTQTHPRAQTTHIGSAERMAR